MWTLRNLLEIRIGFVGARVRDRSMQSGGRNRRGNKNKGQPTHAQRHGRVKQHLPGRSPGLGLGAQDVLIGIDELAILNQAAVLKILKSHRAFTVNVSKWPCPDNGTGEEQKVNDCDAYFDPNTGHGCGQRSRCFETSIQTGRSETIKQRMDGVATKIFVRQNLLDSRRFASFLLMFNSAATNMLKQLCSARSLKYGQDIVFAFKGGNVMHLVLQNLLDSLDPALTDEWNEIMQIGDMDFEVFINDATDAMVRDTTVLILYVLYSFRVYMEKNEWRITCDDDALLAMQSVVPATTAIVTDGRLTHSEDSITVPFTKREGCDLLHVPVRTVLMKQVDKRIKATWLDTGHRTASPLNISLNKSLSFGVVTKKGVEPEADIVLMRMKHGMRAVVDNKCSKKAAAEVIDVSIPTNKDRMHRIKTQDKNVEWFTLYEFHIDGRSIEIHAPSTENFVLDLHMFMFVLSEFPWYDPKLEKRMKRYFWFSTMLRSQKGASPAMIVVELSSAARGIQKLIEVSKTTQDNKRSGTSSIAKRISPWAELLHQIDATRAKAIASGLGLEAWTIFARNMVIIANSVKRSYSALISFDDADVSPAMATSVVSTKISALGRATLAMTAISTSVGLSLARKEIPRA